MFELCHIRGNTKRSIALNTRLGSPISNEIPCPPDEFRLTKERIIVERHGQSWIRRKTPTGWCNCAGHVWATRRTGIYEDGEWQKIKNDDDYATLELLQSPLPGDLALYFDNHVGYLHVGTVMELKHRNLPGARSREMAPWILSKWDCGSGEYFHWPEDVPFKCNFPQYRLEYWTERNL